MLQVSQVIRLFGVQLSSSSALLAAAALLAAPPARAVEESRLPERLEHDVAPYLAHGEDGTLTGVGGVTLAWRAFRAPEHHASIVLVEGYSEAWLKYGELIYDLGQAGYDVYVMDHRGMGFSQRLAPNPQVVHVERFKDYADDLQAFVKEIVLPRAKGGLYMLAHSTGGLIGALVLARPGSPFKAAAMTSPLFQMETGNYSEGLAYAAVSFNVLRGKGKDYAPGRSNYDPFAAKASESRTTHSLARAEEQLRQYRTVPETCMGGPSNQWVRGAIRETWQRKALARHIQIPLLVLQADQDFYVKADGQRAFCGAAAQCKLTPVPGSYHEILQERDEPRDAALAQILAFFR